MSLSARMRLAAVALVAVASLAACSAGSPLTALKPYAASDGLQIASGEVRGLNLILFTRGKGEPAVLTGTLDNTGEIAANATVIRRRAVVPGADSRGTTRSVLGLSDGDTPSSWSRRPPMRPA